MGFAVSKPASVSHPTGPLLLASIGDAHPQPVGGHLLAADGDRCCSAAPTTAADTSPKDPHCLPTTAHPAPHQHLLTNAQLFGLEVLRGRYNPGIDLLDPRSPACFRTPIAKILALHNPGSAIVDAFEEAAIGLHFLPSEAEGAGSEKDVVSDSEGDEPSQEGDSRRAAEAVGSASGLQTVTACPGTPLANELRGNELFATFAAESDGKPHPSRLAAEIVPERIRPIGLSPLRNHQRMQLFSDSVDICAPRHLHHQSNHRSPVQATQSHGEAHPHTKTASLSGFEMAQGFLHHMTARSAEKFNPRVHRAPPSIHCAPLNFDSCCLSHAAGSPGTIGRLHSPISWRECRTGRRLRSHKGPMASTRVVLIRQPVFDQDLDPLPRPTGASAAGKAMTSLETAAIMEDDAVATTATPKKQVALMRRGNSGEEFKSPDGSARGALRDISNTKRTTTTPVV